VAVIIVVVHARNMYTIENVISIYIYIDNIIIIISIGDTKKGL